MGTVYGDENQLEQLFQNLLSNSLKYRKEQVPPEIKIKGEMLLNGYYQVVIQDNGIGFKEEYLDRIFRPFERLHGESQYAGTGMGLAICKKIIERHGGQITASSIEGEGSAFILYLPTTSAKDTLISKEQMLLSGAEND
jgi:signal transduction histidine kinase